MKKIGIIGAMESEVEMLKSKMTLRAASQKASMEFLEGTLDNVEIVIVRSGIGKVNAGICTQILCDTFRVTHIINTGIAGSLHDDIDIGDIVVSTDAMYHDMDATIFGYAPGEVPQIGCAAFPADKHLIEAAVSSCRLANPDIKVFTGRVITGDQFISDHEKKEYFKKQFEPFCVEMEGAAIAHAAYLNHIPFVILRAISDKADGSAEMDYPLFEEAAAKHSAKLVEKLITAI